MRRALWAAVLASAVGCEKVPVAPKATEPEPKKAEPKKGDTPRKPPEKKSADPPKAATFDEAWAEAVKMGEQLDAEEPAATKKATAVLTAAEREEVREQMGDALDDVAGSLVRAGFTAWVARESRKIARGDAAFRAVARELWDGTGVRHVLGMMNSWGAVDPFVRREVAAHVARKTPTAELEPDVRNAILNLGGEKWLAR